MIYLYEFVSFACLGFGYFIFAILLPLQKKSGRQNGRRARWGRVRCGQNIGQKSQKWENRILPLVEGNIIDHVLIFISDSKYVNFLIKICSGGPVGDQVLIYRVDK